jgi:surfeit locus 1 family protein
MRIGNITFSPRWWAILLTLAVACTMLSLGLWQLRRADEKIAMQAAAELARTADAVPVGSIENVTDAAGKYSRVSVDGQYDGEHQLLWDNRTRDGQVGYEVITPVQLSDGQLALVNRGWVPLGVSRSVLPDVSLPAVYASTTVQLQGFFTRPSQGFMSGDALETTTGWPRVLQFFDYDAISAALGKPVVAGIVQLQEQSKPVAREELYAANWQPAAAGPLKHYSYAFQWFAMALAVILLFLFVNSRKQTPD